MELVTRKKAGDELDYEPRINPINEYLEDRIGYFERAVAGTQAAAGGQDRQLDELFQAALKETWGMQLD